MSSVNAPVRKDSCASSQAGDEIVQDPYSSPAYLDALDEVHTRFILNLPDSELETADRIFFQLEQAWWFYEDFICDPNPERSLPRFSTFKPFAAQLFSFSPLLPDPAEFSSMWQQFSDYKRKISNYGCILLSQDCSRVILCRLWDSKTHTFPAGKINQGENGLAAAARETYEETGFDPLCMFGLTASWKESPADKAKITWKPLREQDALVFQEGSGKRRTCYVCHGVPEDFPFAPVVRKEVSEVAWHGIDAIPKPSYAVGPFMSQLKRWIKKNKQGKKGGKGGKREKTPNKREKTPGNKREKTPNRQKTPTRSQQRRRTPNRQSQSRSKAREDDDVVVSGLASVGDVSGWSEEDMFEANEKLLGRKVEYDGNPHVFAEHGFAGEDPHAFRVVGGKFLNAEGVGSLAPAPEVSKLQPLFLKEDGTQRELKPFFSDEGVTPWGEAVDEAKSAPSSPPQGPSGTPTKKTSIDEGQALLNLLQSKTTTTTSQQPAVVEDGGDDFFLTDVAITAKSQAIKLQKQQQPHQSAPEDEDDLQARIEKRRAQYEADMAFVRDWVARLPKPKPSKYFGDFRLDADAIMANAAKAVAAANANR